MSIIFQAEKGSPLTAQEVDGNFQFLLNNIGQSGILNIGTYSFDELELTMDAGWSWSLFGSSFTTVSPFVHDNEAVPTDNVRVDIVCGNELGGMVVISGPVGATEIDPSIPNDLIPLLRYVIEGDSVEDVDEQLAGFLKRPTQILYIHTVGNDLPLNYLSELMPYLAVGEYSGSGAISGVNKWVGQVPYATMIFSIENQSNDNIPLAHNGTGDYKFIFPDNLDYVLKPKEVVSFRLSGGSRAVFLATNMATAGGGVYNGNSPSTVTVQNIPSGTNILGMTFDELVGNIYAPFVAPTFSAFSMNGQSTSIEVGTTLSGSKVFSHSFTNVSNIVPNSLSILDVTNNTPLASGEEIGATTTANIGTVQKTTAAAHSWRGRVTTTQAQTVNSDLFTVNWRWKVYWGTSSEAALSGSLDVLSLVGGNLKPSLAGAYSFVAGDYKYFVSPNAMGNIAAIKDQLTGFDIPLADVSDNSAYNQTQPNGLTYAILSVTNAQSVTVNHRVYRSKNILGGSVNAIITI